VAGFLARLVNPRALRSRFVPVTLVCHALSLAEGRLEGLERSPSINCGEL
jgi:hypothetical protein